MKTINERIEENKRGILLRETLEKNIKPASKVFIVGHNKPDFDSIGAAAGIKSIANQFGKEAYIVVGDSYDELDPSIKPIIDDYHNKLNMIDVKEFEKKLDENSVLVVCDANKKNRICLDKYLDLFKRVIIVDHHDKKEGETIEGAIELIFTESSSASELVTQAMLASPFEVGSKKKLNITSDIATLLYAGIDLDTDRFKLKDTTSNITHKAGERLLECGADKTYINNLFRNDRATFNTYANLVINGTVIKQYSEQLKSLNIAFALNRENPTYLYRQEDLARASDKQVCFKDTDAAFTLGYIKEGLVSVSARSSSPSINVGKIMESLEGGGTAEKAGAQVFSTSIYDTEEELIRKVEEFLSLQESQVVEIEPDLTEEVIHFKKVKKKKKKK